MMTPWGNAAATLVGVYFCLRWLARSNEFALPLEQVPECPPVHWLVYVGFALAAVGAVLISRLRGDGSPEIHTIRPVTARVVAAEATFITGAALLVHGMLEGPISCKIQLW